MIGYPCYGAVHGVAKRGSGSLAGRFEDVPLSENIPDIDYEVMETPQKKFSLCDSIERMVSDSVLSRASSPW